MTDENKRSGHLGAGHHHGLDACFPVGGPGVGETNEGWNEHVEPPTFESFPNPAPHTRPNEGAVNENERGLRMSPGGGPRSYSGRHADRPGAPTLIYRDPQLFSQ